jgi:hypothetical protein
MAARRSIEAGRPSQSSTAIMSDVRVREEKVGGVVGGDMKGAEGAHYQGMSHYPMRYLGADYVDATVSVDPLLNPDHHGSWTLMQPIYTKEVSHLYSACAS